MAEQTLKIWTGVEAPTAYEGMTFENSDVLRKYWKAEKQRLKDSGEYAKVEEQLFRKLSIETGLIEGAYTIIEDERRGVTVALIKKGFEAAELSHDTTDNESKTRATLQAQFDAYSEHAMPVIKGERDFNEHFLKAAHVVMMGDNPTHQVPNQHTGKMMDVELKVGVYKDFENSPMRPDGVKVLYCPWLQTPPEMEKLFSLYEEWKDKLHPIALATWFHLEFVKIHPFGDGNGRVARLMASTILIKAGFMPMNVDRLERPAYIDALEAADEGDVSHFVGFVDRGQWPLLAGTAELALSHDAPAPKVPSGLDIESAITRYSQRAKAVEDLSQAHTDCVGFGAAMVQLFKSKHRRIAAMISRSSETFTQSTSKNLTTPQIENMFARVVRDSVNTLINIGTIDFLFSDRNAAGRLRVALGQLSPAAPYTLVLCTSLLFSVKESDPWHFDRVLFLSIDDDETATKRVDALAEKQFARLIDRLAEMRMKSEA